MLQRICARQDRKDRIKRSSAILWTAGVMIEKFAGLRGLVVSEFLDLNHTSEHTMLVSLLIPKFARDARGEGGRTSESGH
jgi:hypothetical protein